jgi:hypothetical protein
MVSSTTSRAMYSATSGSSRNIVRSAACRFNTLVATSATAVLK